MDQIKIGKFIAALRKEKGMTQEQLGEKLGVTNKTISRWENGNYMPDVEMLSLLSKEFGVSINELVSGERLATEDFKKAADSNLVTALDNSTFTLKEKIAFFKKKWLKEHIATIALCVVAWIGIIVCGGIEIKNAHDGPPGYHNIPSQMQIHSPFLTDSRGQWFPLPPKRPPPAADAAAGCVRSR